MIAIGGVLSAVARRCEASKFAKDASERFKACGAGLGGGLDANSRCVTTK